MLCFYFWVIRSFTDSPHIGSIFVWGPLHHCIKKTLRRLYHRNGLPKNREKPFIQAVFYYTWRPTYLSQRKFLACWRKSKLQSKEWYLKSSFEVHFGKVEKSKIGTRLRQACPKTPNSLLGKWHLSFFLSFNSWSLEAFSSTGPEKCSFRGFLKQNNNLLGLVHNDKTT